MTLGMDLCSACNRRNGNSTDDDDACLFLYGVLYFELVAGRAQFSQYVFVSCFISHV